MRHSKKAIIKNQLLFKTIKGVITPFRYFVKESKIKTKPNASKPNSLKNLKQIWNRMSDSDRQVFDKLTKIDEHRYMNEICVVASTVKLYREHCSDSESSHSTIDQVSEDDDQIISRLHGKITSKVPGDKASYSNVRNSKQAKKIRSESPDAEYSALTGKEKNQLNAILNKFA